MDNTVVGCAITFNGIILGVPEVSANLYCNSHTSVLGRLRDYLRLLMKRSVGIPRPRVFLRIRSHWSMWVDSTDTG